MDASSLNMLGLSLPTPAYIIGMVVFSFLGFAAYRIGKTSSRPKVKWIGVAMMFYPYLVDETWVLYLVGIALCVGAYLYREKED